jgi:hypothetical protein
MLYFDDIDSRVIMLAKAIVDAGNTAPDPIRSAILVISGSERSGEHIQLRPG